MDITHKRLPKTLDRNQSWLIKTAKTKRLMGIILNFLEFKRGALCLLSKGAGREFSAEGEGAGAKIAVVGR